MTCFICGAEIDGPASMVAGDNLAHRMMTDCKRVVEALREEIARLKDLVSRYGDGS